MKRHKQDFTVSINFSRYKLIIQLCIWTRNHKWLGKGKRKIIILCHFVTVSIGYFTEEEGVQRPLGRCLFLFYVLLCVTLCNSSFAIILTGKKKLVALLCLFSWFLVIVV